MDRITSIERRLFLRANMQSSQLAPALSTNSRRVWIPDVTEGFLPGWIKSQTGDESSQDASAEVVVAATGEVRQLPLYSLSPMNPPQFDGVEDIADLTHLNEASVINNLRQRYGAANIYVSRIFGDKAPLIADILWVGSHLLVAH